jgi:hypothetical protein
MLSISLKFGARNMQEYYDALSPSRPRQGGMVDLSCLRRRAQRFRNEGSQSWKSNE